jgi:hypothetical protein
MEAALAEPDDLDVPRPSHRPQEVEVRYRLEEVGLALAIISDDRESAFRYGEIGVGEIPEIARLEPAKPVVRVPILRI